MRSRGGWSGRLTGRLAPKAVTHWACSALMVAVAAGALSLGCSPAEDAPAAGGTGGRAGSGGAVQPGTGGTAAPPAGTGGVTGSGGRSPAGSGGGAPVTGSGGAGGSGGGGGAGGGAAGTGGTAIDAGVQPDGGGGGGGGGAQGGTGGGGGGAGGRPGGSGGAGGAPSRRATLVVRGAGTATAGDMVMLGRMRAKGYTVTIASDAAVTAASVAAMDLVVISSSAESSPLAMKLRDIAVPILCAEDGQYRNQSMTGRTENTDWGKASGTQSAVTILPTGAGMLGAGFAGNVTFSSVPGELGWGNPGPAAIRAASVVGNANQTAIFGYERGAQMVGMAAPARRAGFAIREALASNLSADGVRLFDALLDWVVQ